MSIHENFPAKRREACAKEDSGARHSGLSSFIIRSSRTTYILIISVILRRRSAGSQNHSSYNVNTDVALRLMYKDMLRLGRGALPTLTIH